VDHREKYPALLRALSKMIDLFLAVAGVLVLVLIFTNVVLRGAAGFDLAWSLEVTAFLLLWLTFIGCAAAMARGAHMRVTEIIAYIANDRAQRIVEVLINIAITVILISLIYNGYTISEHTWSQKTTVLYWPVGFLYASMPVGIFLTLIFHLYNFYLDVKADHADLPSRADSQETHDWEDYE
jgi:TRAP-type C4-dicarboxylate transport system permease small subunit